MDWTEIFKHFALYGLVSTLLFGYILFRRTKHLNSARVSFSATTDHASYLIFATGITITTGLLAANVYGYMLQRISAPSAVYWIFGILFLLLIVLAWIPASDGKKYRIHHWAAWLKTYLMFAAVALLYVNSYENTGSASDLLETWMQALGVLFVLLLAIVATYTNLPNLSAKKSLHSQQLIYLIILLAIITRVYVS